MSKDRRLIDAPRQSWVELAACTATDPELFFTDNIRYIEIAKRICNGCPVKEECLDHAIDNKEPYGIRGGQTARERARTIRRNRY